MSDVHLHITIPAGYELRFFGGILTIKPIVDASGEADHFLPPSLRLPAPKAVKAWADAQGMHIPGIREAVGEITRTNARSSRSKRPQGKGQLRTGRRGRH